MTLPGSEQTGDQRSGLGNDSPVRYTQADRERIIVDVGRGFGGIFRKHSRIVAVQENEPFEVETDRGLMRGEPGDWIVTNHPDDDSSSDVWSISNDRMLATYYPWDRPTLTVEVTPMAVLLRQTIAAAVDQLPEGRHRSLIITKLEEALLWLHGETVIGE